MKILFGIKYDSSTWTWFDIIWPWIGLALAIILFGLLLTTNIFRKDILGSRWRDAQWLSWLAIPIYMIHQFEEYGIDLIGERHAFPNGLCRDLGLGNYPTCPIPHEFYLFVNIPLVWFFAIYAARISVKNPFVGLGLYSVIISNGVVHIGTFLIKQEYNPGLFTALIIFLPSFIWLCRACYRQDQFQKKEIFVLIFTGIVLHAFLISSVFAFVNHKIGRVPFDFIQIINASTIIFLPWIGVRFLKLGPKRINT